MVTFENRDCMAAMKEFPDNFFSLAIVDPPYGDGGGVFKNRFGGMFQSSISGRNTRPNGTPSRKKQVWGQIQQVQESPGRVGNQSGGVSRKAVQRTGGTWAAKYAKKIIAWDVAPPKEYFEELFRISRNQIIFGGNYFDLPPTRCFIVFRKTNIPAKGFSMAPVEYAWTSFNENAKLYEHFTQSTPSEKRFHPCQKPIELYKDCLQDFAKPGDKILDTHVGSGSSLVACYDMGYDVWGYELDEVYYKLAKERLDEAMAQIRMDI